MFSASICLPTHASEGPDIRQGLPGRRISGGVRTPSSCLTDFNQSVVAVIPRSNLGTTAQAHPAFWFSLPETTAQKSIAFELFNSDDELIYRTQLQKSSAHGVSEFQLPASAPALEVGENYRWVFSLSCESDPYSLAVQGWVQREELSSDLSARLSQADPMERAELYGLAGLWHEQMTELSSLRRTQPENSYVQARWEELVHSTGLSAEIFSQLAETMIAVPSPALTSKLEG